MKAIALLVPLLLLPLAPGCDSEGVTPVSQPPPPEWTCDAARFNGSDGCDCGCGAPDPDCGGASDASACEYCLNCDPDSITDEGCVLLDPADMTQCLAP